MMIAIHAGNTVLEYAQAYPEVAARRPERCPRCGAVGKMIGHGRYPRQKPLETTPEPPRPLKIRRWKCTTCKRTPSLLPDVLHRYRQYTWAVMGAALVRRFVLGQTWRQIQAALSQMPDDVAPAPSVDSLRRWCKAFASHALAWLQAMLAVLAQVWPQLAQLNAHGIQTATPPQQLLQATAALASWLSPARGAWATTTVADVRTVWRWGWNQGLGRLT
jgi:transposase